jgi:hypothetical protein
MAKKKSSKKEVKTPASKPISAQEKYDVNSTIENEGFDYTFRHYSSFKEITDAKFHELREAYVKAADALENYVTPSDEEIEHIEGEQEESYEEDDENKDEED